MNITLRQPYEMRQIVKVMKGEEDGVIIMASSFAVLNPVLALIFLSLMPEALCHQN